MPKINLITVKKINLKDMYIISRQISVMLSSGLNIVTVFNIIKNQKNNKKTSKALNSVVNSISSGESLYISLKKTKYFPDNFINMIMVGESTGRLDEIFSELSDYYYREYKIKQTIKQALAYPIFILVTTVVCSIIMSITILPIICSMIEELEIGSIPLPTKILLGINEILDNSIGLIILTVVVLSIGIFIGLNKDIFMKKLFINIPLVGSLYKKRMCGKFARILAILYSSGVPIVDSLEICEEALGSVYRFYIKKIRILVESGESLYSSIKATTIFPEFFSNIIETGEETGRLDFSLNKIGEFYEKEVEFSIKRIVKLFEPTLIVSLSIIVGFLLAAVMLPLFQLYGEI